MMVLGLYHLIFKPFTTLRHQILYREVVFIHGIKNDLHTVFFIHLQTQKVYTFILNSYSFHNNILASFVPKAGIFVIVSKEGISLHTSDINEINSKMFPITNVIYRNDIIIYKSRQTLNIARITEQGFTTLLNTPIGNMRIPTDCIEIADFILLLYPRAETPYIRKFKTSTPLSNSINTSIPISVLI